MQQEFEYIIRLTTILINWNEKVEKQRNVNKIKTIVESIFNYEFTNRLLHIESNLNSSSNGDNLYLTCISFIDAVIDNNTTVKTVNML